MLIMGKHFIEFLLCVNSVNAERLRPEGREHVHHVDEVVTLQVKRLLLVNEELSNLLVQVFVLLCTETLHNVHHFFGSA